MALATDAQVQRFSDERIRPHVEAVRELLGALVDDTTVIGDVYARCADAGPWFDARTDGPARLMTKNDILAYNTFAVELAAYIQAHAQWSVVRLACVRPVNR